MKQNFLFKTNLGSDNIQMSRHLKDLIHSSINNLITVSHHFLMVHDMTWYWQHIYFHGFIVHRNHLWLSHMIWSGLISLIVFGLWSQRVKPCFWSVLIQVFKFNLHTSDLGETFHLRMGATFCLNIQKVIITEWDFPYNRPVSVHSLVFI